MSREIPRFGFRFQDQVEKPMKLVALGDLVVHLGGEDVEVADVGTRFDGLAGHRRINQEVVVRSVEPRLVADDRTTEIQMELVELEHGRL